MSINRARKQQGFTLVELLIVVIILGILAAVVIPQFNTAASESKEAALASNLATVRQAIEMYKVQHSDSFPTVLDGTTTGQLINKTDASGTVSSSGQYGPYLRNSFPKNPVNALATISVVTTTPSSADGTTGWVYNSADGTFKANSTGTGPSGASYFSL